MVSVQWNEGALADIANLVGRPDVCSVACYLTDPSLWRIFLNEQVRRAEATGLPPQVAFSLCGPDTGLPFKSEDLVASGRIHIPFEGITGGDLFIQPAWRRFDPDHANRAGSLRAGNYYKECHYLITTEDYGDLRNSRRSTIGSCFLYEPTTPYQASDPLGIRQRFVEETQGLSFLVGSNPEIMAWFDGKRLPAIFPHMPN